MANILQYILLHFLNTLLLILLNLILIPLDTYVLVSSYTLQLLVPSYQFKRRRLAIRKPGFKPRTILITGIETLSGLALARGFYTAGHTVIGADFDQFGVPSYCRFSLSVKRFYALTVPHLEHELTGYVQDLEHIVRSHNVDLWIPCRVVLSPTDDARAAEAIRRRTSCVVLQFAVETTNVLLKTASFVNRVRLLGLPTLETYDIKSRNAIHKVIDGANKRLKRYTISPARSEIGKHVESIVLPRRTLSQTYACVSQLTISPSNSWVLQEFVDGTRYRTYSLVIQGEVMAFLAWRDSEAMTQYETLARSSALNDAMLKFTQDFTRKSRDIGDGHFSFEFLVKEVSDVKGVENLLFPLNCIPGSQDVESLLACSERSLVSAYLRALDKRQLNGDILPHKTITLEFPAQLAIRRLEIDLFESVVLSITSLSKFQSGIGAALIGVWTFIRRLLWWQDSVYTMWDPLPWWYFHHIQTPVLFIMLGLSKMYRLGYEVCRTHIMGGILAKTSKISSRSPNEARAYS